MFVITGSPGVGKHTVAKTVAERLDLELIDINTVAMKSSAIIARDEISYVVDPKKLARALRKEIRTKTTKKKKNCLVVGHLAPYVLSRRDPEMVVVIRRSPYELRRVYARRGYDGQKIRDNMTSEIIGILVFDAVKKFGKDKVVEVDCTAKKPKRVADEIISMVKRRQKGSLGSIDWLSLVAGRGELQKFFDYNPGG
ncbi:MAG: adenylate kinase family protein [Nitrososphaerales archaeon]